MAPGVYGLKSISEHAIKSYVNVKNTSKILCTHGAENFCINQIMVLMYLMVGGILILKDTDISKLYELIEFDIILIIYSSISGENCNFN